MRGRPKIQVLDDKPRRFTRVYDEEETTTIWTYDLDRFERGPISVEIKYKPGAEKAMKLREKQAKLEKKLKKQEKINAKKN